MSPHAQRLAILSALAAAVTAGVFILGMRFGAPANSLQSPPVQVAIIPAPIAAPAIAPNAIPPNAVNRDAQLHLDAAEVSIVTALANLQTESPDDPGGPADTAIAQTKAVALDLAEAQAYLQGHRSLVPESFPKRIPGTNATAGSRPTRFRPALENLNNALAEIQKVPHGLDGARDKTITDIVQASTTAVAALRISAGLPPPTPFDKFLTLSPTPARFGALRMARSPNGAADGILKTLKTQSPGNPDIAKLTLADISPALPNFSLDPAALPLGRELDFATEDGFSYFVNSDGKPIARMIIRFSAPSPGNATEVRIMANRTDLTGTLAAPVRYLPLVEPSLEYLAKLDRIKTGSYEPRLLSFSAPFSIQAIWLVSDKGAPDLVYVLASATSQIAAQKLFTVNEFLDILLPLRVAPPVVLVPTDVPDRFQPLHFGPSPGGMASFFLKVAKRTSDTAPDISGAVLGDVLPPLRKFSLNAGQVVAGIAIADAARQTGFAYLLDSNGKTARRGEIIIDARGHPSTLSAGPVTDAAGKYAAKIEPALLHLVTLDQVKNGSYEPSLLVCSSPAMQVLWLTSSIGAPDLFYTLSDNAADLPDQTLFTGDTFLTAFRQFAKTAPPPAPDPDMLNAILAPTAVLESLGNLRLAPSPIGGPRVFLTAAKNMNNLHIPGLADATVKDISLPLRLFNLNNADIANDKGLHAARDSGYNYLLDIDGKTVARGQLHVVNGKLALEGVAPVTVGPFVAKIRPALEHLATLDLVKNGVYEPRLIIADPPPFQAIWLTTTTADPDYIYLLTPASPDLPADKLYSVEDFLNSFRPFIKQRIPLPPK